MPSTKGTLTRLTRVAVLDYGMGNLRSVEKALERVGADADSHRRPRRRRPVPTALILPGVGAFPKAMARIRELGLRLVPARVVGRGPAAPGHLPRDAAAVRALDRARRGRGPRPAGGRGHGARGAGPEGPAHGLGGRALGARRRSSRRACAGGDAVLLRPLVRARGRPTRPTSSGTAEWGERFACAVERGPTLGRPVPPGEVERRRARLLSQLRRGLPPCHRRDPLSRRSTSAAGARCGSSRATTTARRQFDADPLDAASRWVEQGAGPCTSSTSTARARGSRENLEHRRGDRRRGRGARPVRRRAARAPRRSTGRLASGAERVVLGTAAVERRRRWSRRSSASTADRGSWSAADSRAGTRRGGGLGARERDLARRT